MDAGDSVLIDDKSVFYINWRLFTQFTVACLSQGSVSGLDFSPLTNFFATTGSDRHVRVYDYRYIHICTSLIFTSAHSYRYIHLVTPAICLLLRLIFYRTNSSHDAISGEKSMKNRSTNKKLIHYFEGGQTIRV